MFKKTIKVFRKLCFAFLFLYGINVLLASLNIFIPINLPTVLTVSFLGTPGFISLFVVYMIIK